jgi:hypothetical protein
MKGTMSIRRTTSPSPKVHDKIRGLPPALCIGEIAWKPVYELQQQTIMLGANPLQHMRLINPKMHSRLLLHLAWVRYRHDPMTSHSIRRCAR